MDVDKPAEILDKMIDLARWWETPYGQKYGQGFIESMRERERYPALFDRPDLFANTQAFYLQRSLPYFVTDQMVDKIWEFSKGFETLGFYPEDVPCDYGFMWLAKPVYTLDANGFMQCQRVVTWAKQDGGVALGFYADKHDRFDETNLSMRAELGDGYAHIPELTVNHVQPIPWGERTEWFQADAEEYARKYKGPLGDKYNVEALMLASREQFAFCRFLLATWEWMGEQLPYRVMPNRHGARRLGRSNLDARDVLVIDLQQRASDHVPAATHQVVQWHYRWRVREHKRHWTDKHGNRRVTTVRSYIKGDPDLPMVERDVLFNVRRGRSPVELSGQVELAKRGK